MVLHSSCTCNKRRGAQHTDVECIFWFLHSACRTCEEYSCFKHKNVDCPWIFGGYIPFCGAVSCVLLGWDRYTGCHNSHGHWSLPQLLRTWTETTLPQVPALHNRVNIFYSGSLCRNYMINSKIISVSKSGNPSS